MPEDANRTVHAQQAFDFTELFGFKFDPVIFGKARARRLKLLEPDGPSTAGGRQARQSLVLVPDGEGGNLVIGWIDVSLKTAEIRSYNTVAQQFKARYKSRIDIKRPEYDSMLDDLRSFLKIQRIDTRLVEPAVPARTVRSSKSKDPTPPANPGLMIAMLSFGILIGFFLGWVVFDLL